MVDGCFVVSVAVMAVVVDPGMDLLLLAVFAGPLLDLAVLECLQLFAAPKWHLMVKRPVVVKAQALLVKLPQWYACQVSLSVVAPLVCRAYADIGGIVVVVC